MASEPSTGASGSSESSDSASMVSLNSTIDSYIRQAKRKRQALNDKGRSKKATSESDSSNQLMLPIGKMYHCRKRGRGIHIRGVTPANVIFNKECTYKRMLEKCVSLYSEDEQEGSRFYIADSRGVPIWTDDYLVIDGKNGEEKVPWTLMKYIEYSHVKYPSKSKFFCVREAECSDSEGEKSTPTTDDSPGIDGEGDESAPAAGSNDAQCSEGEGDAGTCTTGGDDQGGKDLQQVHVHVGGIAHQEKEEYMEVSPNDQGAPFIPMFVVVKRSDYRNGQASFVVTNQESILSSYCDDYDVKDHMMDVGVEYPNPCAIHPQNPCHYGFIFSGLEFSGSTGINLVEKLNRLDGTVVLRKPTKESHWGVWTGGRGGIDVALLVAVATGGYHGVSTYQWAGERGPLEEEIYPLLYVTDRGVFKCTITTNPGIKVELEFTVSSSDHVKEWMVDVPPSGVADSSNLTHGSQEIEGKVLDHAIRRLTQLSRIDTLDPHNLKLIKIIGQGGFGTVHLASWRGSLVAAKIISLGQRDIQNCMKEIDILKKLHHPNLSALLGVLKEDTAITIISPLVEGANLHDLVFTEEPLIRLGEKYYILIQVCQALAFLHTSVPPLAHLDVKPANIMVDTATLHSVLTDFGLARIMSQTNSIGTRTMLAGSPGFQPPEQLRSEFIGPACDVYAFGGVTTITLTEKVLWPGLNAFQIMQKITLEGQKPATNEMLPKIKDMCDSCFSEVKDRPKITDILRLFLCAISKD